MSSPEDESPTVTPIRTVLLSAKPIDVPFTLHPSLLMQVMAMHQQFGIDYNGPPRHLSKGEKNFRIAALDEELDEYNVAETLEQELDALIDLVVFALGAVERHGFRAFQEGFQRVMEANCKKQVGQNPEKAKGRADWQFDLVKPEGWKPADLSDLVLPAVSPIGVLQSDNIERDYDDDELEELED